MQNCHWVRGLFPCKEDKNTWGFISRHQGLSSIWTKLYRLLCHFKFLVLLLLQPGPFSPERLLHLTWQFDDNYWQQNWASLLMPGTLFDVNFLGKILTEWTAYYRFLKFVDLELFYALSFN